MDEKKQLSANINEFMMQVHQEQLVHQMSSNSVSMEVNHLFQGYNEYVKSEFKMNMDKLFMNTPNLTGKLKYMRPLFENEEELREKLDKPVVLPKIQVQIKNYNVLEKQTNTTMHRAGKIRKMAKKLGKTPMGRPINEAGLMPQFNFATRSQRHSPVPEDLPSAKNLKLKDPKFPINLIIKQQLAGKRAFPTRRDSQSKNQLQVIGKQGSASPKNQIYQSGQLSPLN